MATQLPERPLPRTSNAEALRVWPYQIDYRVEPDPYGIAANDATGYLPRQSVLVLWGVDEHGTRVVARVYGFLPYMYCQAPEAWRQRDPSADELERLRFALEDSIGAKCARDPKFFHPDDMPYVHAVEFQRRSKMVDYREGTEPVVKVTLTTPRLVPKLRACLWNKYGGSGKDELPDDPVVFELDDLLPEPVENAHYDENRDRIDPPAARQRRVRAIMPVNELYECSLGFCERFLIDCKIELCEWFEVPAQRYAIMPGDELGNPNVLFVGVLANELRTLSDTESAALGMPRFYEAGFDIEVANTVRSNGKADFPVATRQNDEILCICMAFHENGEAGRLEQAERAKCEAEGLSMKDPEQKKTILRRQQQASLKGGWYEVFYQGECDEAAVRAKRADKPVFFHHAGNEHDLILLWMRRMLEFGPEFVLSWNGHGFDVPYINDRLNTFYSDDARTLRNVAPNIGAVWKRGSSEQWRAVEAKFESKQAGKRGGYDVKWPGTVWVDVMQRVIKGFKLRSYKLDNVATLFLGEKKEDMDPADITPKWRSGGAGAAEVTQYCCWDAELPWRISAVKQITAGLLAMARVTKVQPESLITRGESIKAYVQLVEMANSRNFIINHHEPPPPRDPNDKGRGEAKFKGAVVIEPRRGFYTSPVITLDFSSLYPSLMISHNLCHSTYVPPECLPHVPESARFRTPAGHWFVKHEVRPGICPAVARRLLRWRKEVRAQAEAAYAAGDYARAAVLDARQLSIKVMANSLYGFTGSDAKLPCFAVSESITAYGREEIMAVKALIEASFGGCIVVYGDTDSVMVKTPDGTSMETAHEMAKEMAKMVNDRYKSDPNSVMSITFEKIYCPYLLINKKRYAGMFWTRVDKPDKMDAKGLENVRRDNAPVTSRTVDSMLRALLQDQSVEKAKQIAKDTLEAVLTRALPFDDFIISNAFSREAKHYKAKKAHIEVNERVAKRTPGREKHEGDRIDYVITTREGLKGAATYAKAEDPAFARQHNVPLDVHWYVENQLKKPITRLLKAMMTKEQINAEIFQGPHMNVRKAVPPRTDAGIGRFLQIGAKRSADELIQSMSVGNDSATAAATAAAAAPVSSVDGADKKRTKKQPTTKNKKNTKRKEKVVDDDDHHHHHDVDIKPLSAKRSADEAASTDAPSSSASCSELKTPDAKRQALQPPSLLSSSSSSPSSPPPPLTPLFAPGKQQQQQQQQTSAAGKKNRAAVAAPSRALSKETTAERTKRQKSEHEALVNGRNKRATLDAYFFTSAATTHQHTQPQQQQHQQQ